VAAAASAGGSGGAGCDGDGDADWAAGRAGGEATALLCFDGASGGHRWCENCSQAARVRRTRFGAAAIATEATRARIRTTFSTAHLVATFDIRHKPESTGLAQQRCHIFSRTTARSCSNPKL